MNDTIMEFNGTLDLSVHIRNRISKIKNDYFHKFTYHRIYEFLDFINTDMTQYILVSSNHDDKEKDEQNNAIDEILTIFCNADPTSAKKYVRWMLDTYLNDGFLVDDLIPGKDSKVFETLNMFIKHKNRLSVDMRSINKFKSLSQVWKSIKEFESYKGSHEIKREDHERAYAESNIILDRQDGLKIICPLTMFASKWFGKGTRWCTAADNNNMFWHYAKYAPLFIVIMPDNTKIQLYKNKSNNDYQIMDENDEDLSVNFIQKHWNILKPIILWFGIIKYVPKKYLTYNICLDIVKRNGMELEFVPEKYKEKELYEQAIHNNNNAIQFVHSFMLTQELCEYVIRKNGNLLCFIPRVHKTQKMCELAIKNSHHNPSVLKNIPIDLYNEKILNMALEQNGDALEFIPDMTPDGVPLKTYKLCVKAVNINGTAIRYVPENLMTEELCFMAIKQIPQSLFFISQHMKTFDICRYALLSSLNKEDSFNIFQYFPKEHKTLELCKIAVKNNANSLFYVPREYITPELCEIAVKQNGLTLQYVPDEYKTKKLCETAVKTCGHSLQHVPDEYKSPELCEIAIQNNGLALKSIPKAFINNDILKTVVNNNGNMLMIIPKNLRTYELCRLAVKNKKTAMQFVPDEHKTPEINEIFNSHMLKYKIENMDIYEKEFMELKNRL